MVFPGAYLLPARKSIPQQAEVEAAAYSHRRLERKVPGSLVGKMSISFRFSKETVEQIKYLCAACGMSQAGVVAKAVREMHEKEESSWHDRVERFKRNQDIFVAEMNRNSLSATEQALLEANNKALKALIDDIGKQSIKSGEGAQ